MQNFLMQEIIVVYYKLSMYIDVTYNDYLTKD